MRQILDGTILASRHLLVVFYLGLAVGLAAYAVRFLWKVLKFAADVFTASDNDLLLGLLYLLDSALVANLVVMVAISSWNSMVSGLEGEAAGRMGWVGKVDAGNLKIKLATSIVAISGIHLLQIFLKAEAYSDRVIGWGMGLHGIFLVSVLALALVDRLEGTTKDKGGKAAGEM